MVQKGEAKAKAKDNYVAYTGGPTIPNGPCLSRLFNISMRWLP